MTSASIMFTVFILGGYTYYMMQHLGIAPQSKKGSRENGANDNEHPPLEIMALIPSTIRTGGAISRDDDDDYSTSAIENVDFFHFPNGNETTTKQSTTPKAVRRQRSVPVKRDELIDL
jgi:hypothetical protein